MKRWKNKPLITYGLLIINAIVFVVWLYLKFRLQHQDGFNSEQSGVIAGVLLGAESPFLVLQLHEYWRIFTAMFVHFGIMHILCNSVFLYAIGQVTETILGHVRYLILYLGSGIIGNIIPMIFYQDQAAVAGASGALFGLLGMWTVMWLMYRHHPNTLIDDYGKEMFTLAVANIVLNLFMSGVSILGHIGGFIGGMIVGFIMLRWFKPLFIKKMNL